VPHNGQDVKYPLFCAHRAYTTPNFGKMHINPVIAFRRSSKVLIAIKTLNAKLGTNGQTLEALSHP